MGQQRGNSRSGEEVNLKEENVEMERCMQFLFMVGMSKAHLKCCKVPQSASCLICVVGKRI